MRGAFAVGVVAVALAAGPVPATGPLDPPTSQLAVRLVERTSAKARPLKLELELTATRDTGAIVSVGFRRGKGGARTVFDGNSSWYLEARRGGFWPVVVRDDVSQLPPCPATLLCSSPNIGESVTVTYTPRDPSLSFYLYVRDVPDLTLSVSEGWSAREVRGGALHTFRDSGTSARLSARNRQYAVHDFRGVSAPRVAGPSVAFASIPCWPWPLPGGDGGGYLTNDTKRWGYWREMHCATYRGGASGGSDRPTTWRNDAASLGWSGGMVNRLVVAVLPPAPKR